LTTSLTLGQFSNSPVVLAARQLGLEGAHGLSLATTAVSSSPGQFAALRDGSIDVAVTSPDNVLLYATTDRNPLGARLDVRIHRPIDRGLGLALVTRPEVSTFEELAQSTFAVDVMRSGFAFLLFSMLDDLGVDRSAVTFDELGSTPARADALIEGRTGGTILNAESRVRAEAEGMRVWRTSADVSHRYLGTVLAAPAHADAGAMQALSSMWQEATEWLLRGPETDVRACLGAAAPILGSPEYVSLMRDPVVGLLDVSQVDIDDLGILVGIRRRCGAYVPDESALPSLVVR
jgi:ABC-type nitrate/sulfonate/bicarbonate transport system substrate-binding protein